MQFDRLLTLLEDNNKRNKFLFFRQTAQSIQAKLQGKVLVVFDTEVTGLSAKLPWVHVTEIAAIAVDADTGKELGQFHKKIKLTDEAKAEMGRERNARTPDDTGALGGPKDMNITKILKTTQYGTKNAPYGELKQVYGEWVEWLNKWNAPIMVAQNAGFDMGHMFAPLKDLGIPRPKIGEVMDTLTMARVWVWPLLQAGEAAGDQQAIEMKKHFEFEAPGGKKKQSFTLQRLGNAFGAANDNWHMGMSDARQTLAVFNGILELIKSSNEKGYDQTDVFKKQHIRASNGAFFYGKRPAFQDTVDTLRDKGVKARGNPRG